MCTPCRTSPEGWFRDLVPYGETWNLVWEPEVVRKVTKSVEKFLLQYVKGKLVSCGATLIARAVRVRLLAE
jgi:hypothetical protein